MAATQTHQTRNQNQGQKQSQNQDCAGPSRPSLTPDNYPADDVEMVENGRDTVLTPRQREKAPASKSGLGVSVAAGSSHSGLADGIQLTGGSSGRGGRSELDAVRIEDSLDQEIDLLIGQYLETRGTQVASELWDEQVLGLGGDSSRREQVENVERAILDGDYSSVEGLVSKPGLLRLQTQKAFLYLCYRQQFLEHVENRESQKAFNLLQKRLKPLEHYQPVPYDFYSLSYLTSASTVHDAPTFRDWSGVGPEREKLVSTWRELMGSENSNAKTKRYVPPDRLRTLLRQAAAWQVSQVGPPVNDTVKLPTLLTDYRPLRLPDRMVLRLAGHTANVKCVDLIGSDGRLGVSGASDSTLRVFSTDDGSMHQTLTGHTSRIWSCSSSESGSMVASGSGDGTIRVWSVANGGCKSVLFGDGGDLYSVKWRPGREDQVVSASYDKILRSWDLETGKQVRTFSGHSQSTLAVAFDSTGNTIASGSKDKHIRLWDAVGGVCIKNITGCLGEITSVEFDREGKYLLAGCKDNSNRLWDLRMQRNLYRYTGHQNTSKNLIRCGFAHDASLIIGGSEDGYAYLWEREGGGSDSIPQTESMKIGGGAGGGVYGGSSGFLSPNLIGHNPTFGSSSGASHPAENRQATSSPAYYPPRSTRSTPHHTTSSGGVGMTVRPLKVLEGHGDGAVFDVEWKEGKMVSAGEDGVVGVWG